jgi:TolB protein
VFRSLFALAFVGLSCCAATTALAATSSPTAGTKVSAGNRIAYVIARGYGDNRRFELVTDDANGGDCQVIASSREPLMSPAWSPDGRQLAYVGFIHNASAIFVVDLHTRTPRLVTQEPGVNGAPAWSPDGQSLAISLSFGRNADIYVVDLASGKRRRLTDNPAIDTEPAWSPDGDQIAFTSDRSGLPQVYVVSTQGGDARRLSIEGKKNMKPAYSPDGTEIAVVHYEGSRSRIGLLHLKGQVFRTVSDGPMDECPSFAPDSGKLIYADVQKGNLSVISTARKLINRIPQQGDVHEVAWWTPGRGATAMPMTDAVPAQPPAPRPIDRRITKESLPHSYDQP